jgi:hypothetical protein
MGNIKKIKPKKPESALEYLIRVLSSPNEAPVAYFFISFFLITPALGIAVNGISNIIFSNICESLKGQFGLNLWQWQLVFTLLSILLIFGVALSLKIPQSFKNFRNAYLRKSKDVELNTRPLSKGFRGLITLASLKTGDRETPAELAINLHLLSYKTLEQCWIICTAGSLPEAKRIVKKITNENRLVSEQMFHFGDKNIENSPFPLLVPDKRADDPNYIRELIDAIYIAAWEQHGLDETEIITDYTGATKSMTAGVILACTEPGRKLQYISQVDGEIKEIITAYKKVQPVEQI